MDVSSDQKNYYYTMNTSRDYRQEAEDRIRQEVEARFERLINARNERLQSFLIDTLPEEIRPLIDEYRRDGEATVRRHLNELNERVREATSNRNRRFRPMSMSAFLNRAYRVAAGGTREFMSGMRMFLEQWMINNGYPRELATKFMTTKDLLVSLSAWLLQEGILQYP
jgi:hypothetical protein